MTSKRVEARKTGMHQTRLTMGLPHVVNRCRRAWLVCRGGSCATIRALQAPACLLADHAEQKTCQTTIVRRWSLLRQLCQDLTENPLLSGDADQDTTRGGIAILVLRIRHNAIALTFIEALGWQIVLLDAQFHRGKAATA